MQTLDGFLVLKLFGAEGGHGKGLGKSLLEGVDFIGEMVVVVSQVVAGELEGLDFLPHGQVVSLQVISFIAFSHQCCFTLFQLSLHFIIRVDLPPD